jgi:site-specific DNA recombinase
VPSTNGYRTKTSVLYARATNEQAQHGYSLRQQMERLCEWAEAECYEVLGEVEDAGHSEANLERPGLDRVRDLVARGGISVVLAQDRDHYAGEPAYLYVSKQELTEHGTALKSLNDLGDEGVDLAELMKGR